jgi:hypothetical protein
MDDALKRAEAAVAANPKLTALTVRAMAGELHLMRGDEFFARRRPHQAPEDWTLDYCRNWDVWECCCFVGGLEECFDFLAEDDHYLFWER